MSDEQVYLRRVRNPQPMLLQLASQAVDALERTDPPNGRRHPSAVAQAAGLFGVPLAYVLDEIERRVREKGQSTP